MLAIRKRAGLDEWPKLWQTLRASCEIEWAQTHPQFAVSKWIGHSIHVSGKHYANGVPDELFNRAAGIMSSDNDREHNREQYLSESARTDSQRSNDAHKKTRFCEQERVYAGQCEGTERVAEGIRTPDPRDHNAML